MAENRWQTVDKDCRSSVICHLWHGHAENIELGTGWAKKMICPDPAMQAEARRLFVHYQEMARAYREAALMLENAALNCSQEAQVPGKE